MQRSTLPREAEASYLADPMAPKLRIEEMWCAPAWPQAEPEWLRFYKFDAAQRAAAQQAWTDRLRVLLPEASSAPSSARREALWQRMMTQQFDGLDLDDADEVPLELLQAEIERVCQQAGLFERQQAGQVTGRERLFLGAGLRAACEEVTGGLIAQRRSFRLILMRLHQYLDVHA